MFDGMNDGAGGAERRDAARVRVATAIDVATNSSAAAEQLPAVLAGSGLNILRTATLVDISRSGARFRSREPVGNVGEQIQLYVPMLGGDVGIKGTILRADPSDRGVNVAVIFDFEQGLAGEDLGDMLDRLLGTPDDGTRTEPRIAVRRAVRLGDWADIDATLEDISLGGARVSLDDAIDVGQDVFLVLADAEGTDLLTLRAATLNLRQLASGRYELGLRFGPMSDERRRCLEVVVAGILGD